MMAWLYQHGGYAMLLVFFIIFSGVALWVYLPRNRQRLEDFRNIPFKGEGH